MPFFNLVNAKVDSNKFISGMVFSLTDSLPTVLNGIVKNLVNEHLHAMTADANQGYFALAEDICFGADSAAQKNNLALQFASDEMKNDKDAYMDAAEEHAEADIRTDAPNIVYSFGACAIMCMLAVTV